MSDEAYNIMGFMNKGSEFVKRGDFNISLVKKNVKILQEAACFFNIWRALQTHDFHE